MKAKHITIPLSINKAITLTLWEDLSVAKVNKMNVVLGFEVAKGTRLNAMERCDTYLFALGPFGVTYSKVYLRGGNEHSRNN